jgi:predicted Zn-dependent peptidase
VIYAGVNPSNIKDAYSAIEELVADLKKDGIKEEEFLRAREQMKSSMLFSQESTSSQMLVYGRYALQQGKVYDFEDRFNRINEMKLDAAMEALELTLDETKKSVALVGNVGRNFSL